MDEDLSASDANRASGSKRSFADVKDDQTDIPVSKKVRPFDDWLYESGPIRSKDFITRREDCKDEIASFRAFLSATFAESKEELASLFRGSVQSCNDELASCQNELESAKTEIDKWKSAFKDETFVPARKSPEPQHVIDYIQTLRSSDKSLKEELEIAKMKLAIHDLKSQLKPESVKPTDGDTEVHGEQQQGTTPSGSSRNVACLEDELRAAYARITELNEYQQGELKTLVKDMKYYKNLGKLLLEKFPDLVPPPAEDSNEQK